MNTEYLMAEYKSVRDEIMKHQERRAQDERYGAAAVVAVYAWLATEEASIGPTTQPLLWFGWWLPVLVTVFGFFRQRAISIGISNAGAYLHRLQAGLDIGEFGWERDISRRRGEGKKVFNVRVSSFYAWLGALGMTVLIAVTATAMVCSTQECGPTALNDLFGYEARQ